MKVCTRCVLPETYPEISFDENGVCNFCNGFTVKEEKEAGLHFKNEEEVKKSLEKYKNLEKILFIPFFVFKFYKTDKKTLEQICRDRFNWQPLRTSFPDRTTNCEMIWLNSYRDLNKRHYTHYHDEYSTLVRAGEIPRELVLKDLELRPPEGLLERLAEECDIDLEDLK